MRKFADVQMRKWRLEGVGAVWVFLNYVVVKNVQMRKCADVQMKI
jgi:hypothetical protein